MTIAELLSLRKEAVIERCLRLTLETYPREAGTFFQRETDPFANPVGSTLRQELKTILEAISGSENLEQLIPSLDAIVRIGAVQDLEPSEALVFTVHLKKAIHDELQGEQLGSDVFDDLTRLHVRIDELTLVAFDLYTKCREKIAELRLGEARAQRDRLAKMITAMGKPHRSEKL
jgi:hypothetical protein